MVRDPSIVSPSLAGVLIGGGHNKTRYRIEVHAAEAVSSPLSSTVMALYSHSRSPLSALHSSSIYLSRIRAGGNSSTATCRSVQAAVIRSIHTTLPGYSATSRSTSLICPRPQLYCKRPLGLGGWRALLGSSYQTINTPSARHR